MELPCSEMDKISLERGEKMLRDKTKKKTYRIVIDTKAFETALKRGTKEEYEVGFYMIGLFKDNTAYVYDIIEFPYLKQDNLLISSDPAKLGKIFTALPLGLRIIGTLHKHPDSLGSKFSSIDAETFRQWSRDGIYIHVIFSREGKDLAAYMVIDDKIRKVDLEIRDLSNERLRSVVLTLPMEFRIYYHPKEKAIDLLNRIERSLILAVSKRLLPVQFIDSPLNSTIADMDVLKFKKKTVIYVVTDRQDFFYYELAYPSELRFGDIKEELISILNLNKDVEFYTQKGLIYDDTPLSELNGLVIYPRPTLEKLLHNMILAEITKISHLVKNQMEESLKQFENRVKEIISSEIKKALNRVNNEGE